ncbi:Beta-glucosidase 18 [Linum perenne]
MAEIMNRATTVQLLVFLFFLSTHSHRLDEGEEVSRSHFPNGFLFGTTTSAYQVEGAYLEDGKGLNNWDAFSHIQGNIKKNHNGDTADNHYHLFLEDIELMHSLGVNAYRFSISWTRILPRGRFGEINQMGIVFYNRILDHLLLKGTPLMPSYREDFVQFARICFESFGSKVKHWLTINEPTLFADMAYIRGTYPPSHCSPPFGNCSAGNSDVEPLIALHNMILAHAKAVKIYRQLFQENQGGSIGIVVNAMWYEPLRENEMLDQQAVSRALAFGSAWILDPLVYGDYPSEMRLYLGATLPSFTVEQRDYVKGSIDFIGLNHYSTLYAKDCLHSSCPPGGSDHAIRGYAYTTGERDGATIGQPTGNSRFFVVPRGLENIVNYLKKRYNNMPIYITENGYAPPPDEAVQLEEILQDSSRIEYHKSYLAALARSIRDGADVRGYFLWSLMDNFEWADGYTLQYGLYYVDRQTLERTPKKSAMWYKEFLTNISAKSVHLSSVVQMEDSMKLQSMVEL